MKDVKLTRIEDINCPQCQSDKYLHYRSEGFAFPQKVGYCPDCGYCLMPFEYENIQKRVIDDFDGSLFAHDLQNATGGDNETSVPWVLRSDYITHSLRDNVLVKYLASIFNAEQVNRAAALYGLDSQKKWRGDDPWHGAAVFYQIDPEYQKIAYKIMQYDSDGHRVKGKYIKGKEIAGQDARKTEEKDLLNQKSLIESGKYCLFGSHLLNHPESEKKKICIVESEKTAIICSIVYPEAIWMATGSCYYLREYKIQSLYKKGIQKRNVVLFPDADVFKDPDNKKLGRSDWYTMAWDEDWLKGVGVNMFIYSRYGKTEKDMADYIIEQINQNENPILFEELIKYNNLP